jgi:trigger factor
MSEETKPPQDDSTQAESQTDSPAPEAADTGPEYGLDIQDAGELKKKLTVTIPRARIDAKYNEMFGELGHSAQIPGFRVGHAPRRLIEKRFGKEVSSDVRNAMVADSLSSVIEKSGLKTLGEPEIDLEAIQLPDQGDMTYAFEVEVMPEFQLPTLEGIQVRKVAAEVTDQKIDEFLEQLRQSRSRFEAAEEPAAEGDMVLAGAKISGEGIAALERPGLNLRVAPGQIEGLPLVDLGKALAGKRAGEKVELKVTVSDAHPNKDWHGKELTVEVGLSQVRRRILPAMDDEFARGLGFDSLAELRDNVTARARQRAEAEVQTAMHEQVCQYLLGSVSFDLPEGAAGRYAERVLQRQAVNLLMRGVPRDQIESRITELRSAAGQQAQRELKLSFILQKIADEKGITVEEGEVNARIAQIAAEQNRRPERLRQEMTEEGTLSSLADSIRQDKVLHALMEKAVVTEPEPQAPADQEPQGDQEKIAEKSSKKKPARKSAGAAKGKTAKTGDKKEKK